ncbi:hypothetical protein BDV12DRAFT_201884 [Aspergillus spectabilis]
MATSCTQCRNRKRKCDKRRPTCTCCAERNLECMYASPTSDVPPSPLVQELASIRERLDYIRDTVNRTKTQDYLHDPIKLPVQHAACITIFGNKSPSLMQMVGLGPTLPSLLYRLERRARPVLDIIQGQKLVYLSDETIAALLHSFYTKVQLCYPVLHPTFTEQLFAAKSYGFPSSVNSCLCLLVQTLQKTSPDGQLTHRLYWIIFVIKSEFSPHFHLASATFNAKNPSLSLPAASEAIWEFPNDTTISPDTSTCPVQAPYLFRKEIELQRLIDQDANHPSINAPLNSKSQDSRQLLTEWCSSLPESIAFALTIKSSEQALRPEWVSLIRVKYHAYEASLYWPAVYHIMVTGHPDPELLP